MENSLQHHGVKGQKWGVRRTPEQLGRRKLTRKKNRFLSGKQKSESNSKKNVKDMTDDEIRTKINRLELEKRYKDLLKAENQSRNSRGKAFVTDILEKSGKNIGTQLTTYTLGTAVNRMLGTDAVDPRRQQRGR